VKVALGLGDLGALAEGAGGVGEGADVDVELSAQDWSALDARGLRDADEEQGEPAQHELDPDPVLPWVAGGP
jgi:hypothetical protein